MKLILSDASAETQAAWRTQFAKWPDVEIRSEPILDTPAPALLLPGNSFGFLDSGLALNASERFGWELQEAIRAAIRAEHSGELLVGQAVVARLPADGRNVVYAPVWRTPRKLDGTINVFLAVRGALLEAARRLDPAGATLAVGGLGIEEGGLDPRVSARQIRYAFEVVTGRRGPGDRNLSQQLRRERKLMMIPGIDAEEAAGGGPAVG